MRRKMQAGDRVRVKRTGFVGTLVKLSRFAAERCNGGGGWLIVNQSGTCQPCDGLRACEFIYRKPV